MSIRALLLVAAFAPGLFAAEPPRAARQPAPIDWSQRQVIVTAAATPEAIAYAQQEPRLAWTWKARARSASAASAPARAPRTAKGKKGGSGLAVDWTVSLGAGTVAATMSPAKYTFDVNATPSCANDFVVFALNVAGSGTQANLVGLNNLYSGTTGGTGLCGTGAATVMFAYNTGGPILTSPVLSMDGTKIAFVESNAGTAVYKVLTWTAGQGTVGAPATPGAVASLTYSGSFTNTRSSIWIDYSSTGGCPCAYVGNDNGEIFKILDPFGTPTLAGAPYPVTVAAGRLLTAPVMAYGYLFVGDSLGDLWAVNSSTGAVVGPVTIGGNIISGTTFGIIDPPIVDASSTTVALFTTSSSNFSTGRGVLAQTKFNTLTGTFGATVLGDVGGGATSANKINLHAPAFDNNYFIGNITATTGYVYVCGTQASATQPTLYRFGFTAGTPPTMNAAVSGSDSPLRIINTTNIECSPITTFANPNIATTDTAFLSTTAATLGVLNVHSFNITGAMPGPTMPGAAVANASYRGGTSAIIVDNTQLTTQQGSSIYFGTLNTSATGTCGGVRCAVKLTQQGLQ